MWPGDDDRTRDVVDAALIPLADSLRTEAASRSLRCSSDDLPAMSGLLGLPEDLRDLVDLGEQLVGLAGVHLALGAGGTGQLGGLVDEGVQLGVLLEVRRLEVVGPQHPEVVFDELGALLLDQDRAGPEVGVVIVGDLGDDRLHRLRLDPRLGRVVDAAGKVAVGRDVDRGSEQQRVHRGPLVWWWRLVLHPTGTLLRVPSPSGPGSYPSHHRAF